MGPLSPADMNLLLGMLARWGLADGASAMADGGADEPSSPPSSSDQAARRSDDRGAGPAADRRRSTDDASPGNLGAVEVKRPTAGGGVADPNVMGDEGLPPAASDDVATRFAPPVPASQSLMGLRQPGAERAPFTEASASPGATTASPDEDAEPAAAQPDRRGAASERRAIAPSSTAGVAGADDGRRPDPRTAPPRTDAATGGPAASPDAAPMVASAFDAAPATAGGGGASPSDAAPPTLSASGVAEASRAVPGGDPAVPMRRGSPADDVPATMEPASLPEAAHRVRTEADARATDARRNDLVPWNSRQDAVVAHRPTPADMPVLRRDDVSDVDGWALPTASLGAAAEGQVERAGIIASFILNAAMIPGWPPPRPFEVPTADALFDRLLAGRAGTPTEEELTAYLDERGAGEGLLSRMRSRLSQSRRLRLLFALTALWTTVEALIDAIEQELMRVSAQVQDRSEEAEEEDARRALTA